MNTQLQAFLTAIADAEGTTRAGLDPYRVTFGHRHTIRSLADHPAVTREWNGRPLGAALCRAAGLGPRCVSTAAGKYQIIRPTWIRLRDSLRLPDFGPASQDAAAIELLRENGALPLLAAGDFAGAVRAVRRVWASLPGAGYGQPERPMAWLQERFVTAGGSVTA